jgi:hypothetical protein
MDLFKKYLLTTVAQFAPPDEGGGPELEREDDGQETVSADEGEGEGLGEDAGGEEGQDDASEDEEGLGEGSVDDQPARRPNRAQSRIQALTSSTREAKEKADRLERELSEIKAAQRAQEQRSQQESPTDRAARRALMDPIEVMREDLRESEQRTAQLLQRTAMESQENNDKSSYNSLLREKPHLKRYDAEVERVRVEQQAAGRFVPREVLLKLAIGDAAMKAAEKKGPQAQREGQRKVAAQQSRPAAGRSDTATQRGRQGDSAEKRLENIPI